MYKDAVTLRIRFQTAAGPITVEDLYSIALKDAEISLDNIAKALNSALNENRESFVEPVSKAEDLLQLQFDLVMDVIRSRILERAAIKKSGG